MIEGERLVEDFVSDEDDEGEGGLNWEVFPEICKGLGIYAEDGEIVFYEFEYLEDEDQYISKEVLETLGWRVYEAGRNGGSRYSEPEFYYVIKSKNQR